MKNKLLILMLVMLCLVPIVHSGINTLTLFNFNNFTLNETSSRGFIKYDANRNSLWNVHRGGWLYEISLDDYNVTKSYNLCTDCSSVDTCAGIEGLVVIEDGVHLRFLINDYAMLNTTDGSWSFYLNTMPAANSGNGRFSMNRLVGRDDILIVAGYGSGDTETGNIYWYFLNNHTYRQVQSDNNQDMDFGLSNSNSDVMYFLGGRSDSSFAQYYATYINMTTGARFGSASGNFLSSSTNFVTNTPVYKNNTLYWTAYSGADLSDSQWIWGINVSVATRLISGSAGVKVFDFDDTSPNAYTIGGDRFFTVRCSASTHFCRLWAEAYRKTITWDRPVSGYYSPKDLDSDNGLKFNISVSQNYSNTTCNLYQNGVLNQTRSNIDNGTVYDFTINFSKNVLGWNYSFFCYNVTGTVINGTTDNRSIDVDIDWNVYDDFVTNNVTDMTKWQTWLGEAAGCTFSTSNEALYIESNGATDYIRCYVNANGTNDQLSWDKSGGSIFIENITGDYTGSDTDGDITIGLIDHSSGKLATLDAWYCRPANCGDFTGGNITIYQLNDTHVNFTYANMAAYGRQPPKAIDPSKEWYLMFKAQSGTGTPNTKLWVDEVSYLNYTPPVPLLTINITWYNPIAANYSPINMTTNNGLVFNFSVAENYSDTSCELYQNGLINSTVSNVFNATVYNIVLNYSTSQNYNYSWYCYNATGAVNGSTFNRSIIINIPPDTCTCAGLNNAWEIDNSDGCNITEGCNLGTGKLNFTGTGTTTCNTTINTTDLGDPGATGVLQINSACKIDVY